MNDPDFHESSSTHNATRQDQVQYAGFWRRAGAAIIDTVLLVLVTAPVLVAVYGRDYYASEDLIKGWTDFLISWVFPAVAVVTFWVYKSATPGKMVVGAKIVDAKSLGKPTTGQLIGRYLGPK